VFHGESGVTLVELIVTIVIIGIALLGVSFSVQYGTRNSADTLIQVRATALAQAYLDEVLSKRFDEKTPVGGVPPCRAPDGPGGTPTARECTVEGLFGPDGGGETRDRFDDVDDYDGLQEGDGFSNPLQDAEGNDRDEYENFSVEICVRYINLAGSTADSCGAGEDEVDLNQNNELDDEYDAKYIVVTVTDRGSEVGYDFGAYKVNF
jgi:MSHA pilin protein MshD